MILRALLEAISAPRCGCAGDGSGQVTDSDTSPATDSSLAEAEEEVLRAEARAEAARALATQLHQDAEAGSGDGPALVKARRWRPPRVRLPDRKTVAVGVGILLACASLGASGYMLWHDHAIMHKRQLAPQFAEAARVGVETFMSIDPNHAKENIQRSIDASTGDLKTQLEAQSSFMAQRAEESKVVSKITVEAVGVESFTENSGVALVSAKSDVTDPDNSKRTPMLWRISVKIERDAGQLKMSRIDFLQ